MSKIKVLLVDDEAEFVQVMATRLGLRDIDSRVALTGTDALRMVREDAPDVMVLDLRMPGIDGMAVLERMKTEHPGVEVIILTGHGSSEEEREARRLGAAAYLEKPADVNRLVEAIRSAWKKGAQLVRASMEEMDRSLAAAALAEANAPDLARGMLERADRTPGKAEPDAPPRAEAEAEAPAAAALKVLFVDDEEDFVRTMAERMAMRDLGGDVALSGQQALEMLEGTVPDVMVLDLKMPGIDGMEVLRRVKRGYPHVQVIILTGHGSDDDREDALRLGASDYLHKPVALDVLMDAVRRAGHALGGRA